MTLEWLVRPFDPAAFCRDVENPHPRAGVAEVGDNVVLYLQDDDSQQDIRVQVTEIHPDGRMAGIVSNANRSGARGDEQVASGAAVGFEARHVIRIEKAT